MSRLTIVSNPDPSTAGRSVTISGQLFGSNAAKTISLWQKLPGQSGFTRVAHTTTNSSGNYTFVRGPQTNRSWYTTAAGATSPTLLQRVRAQVRLGGWVGGGLLKLGASVSPSHRAEDVALQQRTGKGWRTITPARIGRLSKFTVRHRFAHKGKVVLRVLFAGDARNAQSASAPLSLSIP